MSIVIDTKAIIDEGGMPSDTGSKQSMWRSWEAQRRVIGALLMREILTRYGRHNIGFLWIFLEPMLFTLGVTALWTFLKATHSGFPIAAFAVTGYSSILLWRNMPNRCLGAIGPNLQLLYHRNVKVIDIFLSRILLEAAGATVSFIVLATLFTTMGWMEPPEDLFTIVIGWLMLCWFGASLALLIGSLGERYEIIDRVWHIITYLLFPLSGAAFNVDALPLPAQQIILLFPMVHGVELVREGYFGSAFRAHYDLSYMSAMCLLLTVTGLAAIRNLGREVSPG